MKNNLKEIKSKAVPILRRAGVTRSSVFGSVARNEAGNDSDIDFLIDLPRDKNLFDFIDLEYQLKQTLKKEIDLVEYHLIKPQLKDSILKEKVDIL